MGGRKSQEIFKNKLNQDKQFENKNNHPPCEICKKKNHLEKDCWHKNKQCKNWKRIGHIERDSHLKRNQPPNFTKEKEENYLYHAS